MANTSSSYRKQELKIIGFLKQGLGFVSENKTKQKNYIRLKITYGKSRFNCS